MSSTAAWMVLAVANWHWGNFWCGWTSFVIFILANMLQAYTLKVIGVKVLEWMKRE